MKFPSCLAAVSACTLAHHLQPTRIACACRMMDYLLANALQQSLLHALAQLLGLLSGTSELNQSQLHAESLQRLSSTISSVTSLQSGQPQPVLSWQTGPAGAQPLPSIDPKTGMPVAQLQQSRRSTGTASIPTLVGAMQPWVDMTLLLSSSGDDLVFKPPVADLVRHFDNVLRDLPNTIAVVQRLLTHPELEVTALHEAYKCMCYSYCMYSTCKTSVHVEKSVSTWSITTIIMLPAAALQAL